MSKFGNVGVDGDGAAALNTTLADADETAAVAILGKAARMFVSRLALRDPVLRALVAKIDKRARDHRLQHLVERGAGFDDIGKARIDIAELLVEKDDSVFRVVKHETFRDRGDRGRDGFALRLGLGRKAVALPQTVTKQRKGLGHGADFVGTGRRDWH